MERSQYAPVTPSYEAPNPLRPYYRPQSIAERAAEFTPNISSTTSSAAKSLHRNLPTFGSSAREILSDLNYGDVLGDATVPTTAASVRGLLDQAVWRYSSVFMAQPFEVAKMVLQCRVQSVGGITRDDVAKDSRVHRQIRRHQHSYEDHQEEEEEDDEPSYFTYATPRSETPLQETPLGHSRKSSSRDGANRRGHLPQPMYRLDLRKAHSLLEVIGQLWQREGAWGIWKGTNISFIYSLLLRTVQTWTRSMLSALLNLPDPGLTETVASSAGGLDILDSPSPLVSLGVVVISAGIAGFVLAPLDIVRTRIMLSSVTVQPRSILASFNRLQTWTCPSSLFAPTLIHSTLPTLISTSTPLFLRTYFRIDPLITPASYSICTFLSSVVDLFATLPFETVLRRGQIDFVAQTENRLNAMELPRTNGRGDEHDDMIASDKVPTVVDVGRYNGVFGTMWRIISEEAEIKENTAATTGGAPESAAYQPVYTTGKGQGVQGLWRGWRVGMWGIVGVWGAAALGQANSKGGEF